MKSILKIWVLLLTQFCYSQAEITDDVNDTLSVNNYGIKISLETDLQKSEKLNLILLNTINKRKNLKNLNPKVKKYYQLASISSSLSVAYYQQVKGNYKKSIEINIQALKESIKLKNKSFECFAKMSIGFNFLKLEEYNSAIKYYKDAEVLAKYNNEQPALGYIYVHMATVFNKLNDNKNSLKYNLKSLEIRKKLNIPSQIAYCYNNIGKTYLSINELYSAEKNFKLSEKYNLIANDKKQLADNYLQLSTVNFLKKKDTMAVSYLLKSNNFSDETKTLDILKTSSLKLSEYYKKNKKYNLALSYIEKVIKTERLINTEQNKSELLKAEFNYETEKKEAQIKALSQQKKIANLESQRQKTTTLILGIALVTLLITSYFLFNRFKIKKQNELLKSQLIEAEKTIEAEKKATESELKALKSQMNPHFIFNALSSIQDQFMYGDKIIANEQMGNFTYLTRQILNVSGKKQILLSTEIDILSKYLELEKMRFKTDFEYKITTSKNIDEDYHEIPPMLIQPFVENSIKHGLLHQLGHKKLTINFELDANEEYIICTIIDNGIGRQKSAEIKSKSQNNHQSFSTQSIRERLYLLNENVQLNDLIVYTDLTENGAIIGTKVTVNIPLV